MKHERGFSLIEALIATAVTAIIFISTLGLVKSMLHGNAQLGTSNATAWGATDLVDGWHHDAETAMAIFVPSSDVNGQSTQGHEVDFFTRDGMHNPTFWAYYYDASAKTVQRYTYTDPTNRSGTKTAKGSPVAGITTFSATMLSASQLPALSAPGSILQVLAAKPPIDYTQEVGYGPEILAGNRVARIQLATANNSQTVDLTTTALPSHSTVVTGYFGPVQIAAPSDPILLSNNTTQLAAFSVYQLNNSTGFTASLEDCSGYVLFRDPSTGQTSTTARGNVIEVTLDNSITADIGKDCSVKVNGQYGRWNNVKVLVRVFLAQVRVCSTDPRAGTISNWTRFLGDPSSCASLTAYRWMYNISRFPLGITDCGGVPCAEEEYDILMILQATSNGGASWADTTCQTALYTTTSAGTQTPTFPTPAQLIQSGVGGGCAQYASVYPSAPVVNQRGNPYP